MCLWNPGNRDDEQVAVRHADTSGGDIRENQHEEDRMRDVHVGKRGPEAAGEEQLDKLRTTVRFEQEVPSAAASSDPTVALVYFAGGETQDRPGSVLVQKSGHVGGDVQISALDPFYEMDGRKSRYIGEVLEWHGGEDARDLERSESNELVENLTCLNALEVKFWKSDQKVVMDDKINQEIVMDINWFRSEVCFGSVHIQNWWMGQSATHQSKFVGRIIDENEPWLLIGVPSRDPFICDPVLGEALCEFRSAHEEIDVTS